MDDEHSIHVSERNFKVDGVLAGSTYKIIAYAVTVDGSGKKISNSKDSATARSKSELRLLLHEWGEVWIASVLVLEQCARQRTSGK